MAWATRSRFTPSHETQMKKHFPLILLLSTALGVGWAQSNANTEIFTSDRSTKSLLRPYTGLGDDALDQFILGRSFFTIPWVEAPAATTARDGLGPLFNANSCVSCHKNNGGGSASTHGGETLTRSITIQLAQVPVDPAHQASKQAGFFPDPVYGAQLAINGNHDVPFEGRVTVRTEEIPFKYPDGSRVLLKKPTFMLTDLNYGPLSGTTTINPRRAPLLIGLGLIDSIPASQILQRADEQDQNRDGLSGKINLVWSMKDNSTQPGRFGWKATKASVVEQSANALYHDLGLTNPWFPAENCTPAQTACNAAYKSEGFDIPMHRLAAISYYLTHLQVPVNRKKEEAKGGTLFRQAGCLGCHQTGYTTDTGVVVDPYSDFLLHDMGPELADNSRMFEADPSEWRTAPLWGLGLAKKLNPKAGYLHDGRATTIEQAILWHGGEAESAKQTFIHLNRKDRTALLSFLESL